MKALRWHAKGDIRYEDIPEPATGPGMVKVKIHYAGICGSDLHEFRSGPVLVCTDKHPITGRMAPIILGHEFSGEVVEVGSGVTKYKPGDRVTGDDLWTCGKCFFCMRNQPNLCVQLAFIGFQADGAMAEYMVVPEMSLYKIPDSLSDEVGALVEPLEVGTHAVRQSNLQIGDTVAILGAGTIGVCTFLAAQAAGASKIFVVEISKIRRDRILSMGASAVINPKEVNATEQICEMTNCLGADISFDCVGLSFSGPMAFDLARKGGTVVIIGISPESTPNFNFVNFMLTEKKMIGSCAYAREAPLSIDLLASGRIDVSMLITGKVPLDEGVAKGFKELINNPEKHLKILLQP